MSNLQADRSDAEALREYLDDMGYGYSDLTDEELAAVAERAKAWVGGRRWSWKIVARNILRDGAPHA